jgi:hypothetical protein
MEKFRNDPECKVFLSTDAGGVGLNLQVASAVVNFEPPWNPARLEQRIGRVHRLGQSRPVHVIHMLTSDSIEERVWETLSLKKSLFSGVFDSPTGEVSFAKLGRKTVFQAVKEIFADQPGRPKPVIESTPPAPVASMQAAVNEQEPALAPTSMAASAASASIGNPPAPEAALERSIETAAASFIEAGLRFLETIASGDGTGSTPASRLDQPLAGLFTRDGRTNRPVLSIPVPESVTPERISGAISALLNAFGGTVKASGGSGF